MDFSTVEEIRLKVNQYFKKLKGIGGPRVMELFKKLNATLENPDSQTKQTVYSSSSYYFISLVCYNVSNVRDWFLCSILNQVFELFVQLVLQVEELKNSNHSPNRSQNMVSKNMSLSDANSGTFPPVVVPTNTPNISMLSRHQRRNDVKMKDPNCENLKAFTILPNDSSKEVRKKQGTYLNCI